MSLYHFNQTKKIINKQGIHFDYPFFKMDSFCLVQNRVVKNFKN